MIYSTSAIYAQRIYGSPYHFLQRQILHCFIGFFFLRLGIKFPFTGYKKLIPVFMLVTFLLMIFVLIPGVGTEVGNARRWIRFLGVGIQPSELLKFTLIAWVAGFLDRRRDVLGYFFRGLFPTLIVMSVFFLLLMLQPDFGTAVLINLTLFIMIFAAGVKPFHMLGCLSGLGVIGGLLIVNKTYRMRRVTGFLDPYADPLDSGFQLIQSFIAFGTGGIFGKDLGNSQQKLFFLPEGHTDFIFSILAEETGFIGVMAVLILLLILLVKGVDVALECRNDFGRNLAFGITTLIILQSFLHIGVCIGILPTKGIPLPFISYGGSSLILNMFLIGVLVNIANSRDQKW